MQLRLATHSVRLHVGELKKLALALALVIKYYMDRDVCHSVTRRAAAPYEEARRSGGAVAPAHAPSSDHAPAVSAIPYML